MNYNYKRYKIQQYSIRITKPTSSLHRRMLGTSYSNSKLHKITINSKTVVFVKRSCFWYLKNVNGEPQSKTRYRLFVKTQTHRMDKQIYDGVHTIYGVSIKFAIYHYRPLKGLLQWLLKLVQRTWRSLYTRHRIYNAIPLPYTLIFQ